jgi:hypothetical protein
VADLGKNYFTGYWEVEMAGFNADLELGRIAREMGVIQSKKLMRGIKGIYLSGLKSKQQRSQIRTVERRSRPKPIRESGVGDHNRGTV